MMMRAAPLSVEVIHVIGIESRLLQLCALVTLGACASQARVPDQASLAPMTGCPGRTAESDGTAWQEVQGDGFSFCVPQDWRRAGLDSLEGDGGSVSWGRGERLPYAVATLPGQEPSQRWSVTENIGGTTVALARFRTGSTYRTSAVWRSPRMYFSGEASTPAAARLHIMIYRTVRFASAPQSH